MNKRGLEKVTKSLPSILSSSHTFLPLPQRKTRKKSIIRMGVDLVMIAILTSVRCYFIVALICISLITGDVESFYMSVGHLFVLLGEMSIQVLIN